MAGPWEQFQSTEQGPWSQFAAVPSAPTAPPPEKPLIPSAVTDVFHQFADVPIGFQKGVLQGIRMVSDMFGANNAFSKSVKQNEEALANLMSAQAKNDQQEIARILKEAEDKGVLDQVKAGVKAFTVAPVDTLTSALGTAAPAIVAALGAKVLGAGALITTGVSVLTGAGMGAGTIKGTIYEETKQALLDAGVSEPVAEERAQKAQEYGGKNLDQILAGAVIGGVAAKGPLEKGAVRAIASRISKNVAAREAAESVSEKAAKGAITGRIGAGAAEALPEFGQAAQEKIAANIAQQREGLDVPTFRGAVASGTLEGLAGFGLGAAMGKPTAAPQITPATPPASTAVIPPPAADTAAPPAPAATIAPETPVAETPVTPTVETPVAEAPPVQPAVTATAPSAPETPPPMATPEGTKFTFETAKGSQYFVFEDGTTQRNKAPRPEHPGDQGVKERTARTIYVDGDASRLSAAGVTGMEGARVIIDDDGTASLVWKNPQTGALGSSPVSSKIKFYDEPAVGRSPLELWSRTEVAGREGYSGMHAGNKIVKLAPIETKAPAVEAKPSVAAPAAPAPAAPKFEPQIISRQPAPDGMEIHVFTTTDGYGTGLFDADANQYVNGSVTRFAGEDTLPKAEARAAEMLNKATPVETAAPKPELSDFQKKLQDYWGNTATPAIRNYLSAISSFGIDRLEKNQIKPAGMTPREWLESFVSKQSTWDKGRKTGETGIQALSTKNLWPTTDGSGERLRKAMLEAVKVLKNAPGSTGDLVSEAFGERASTPKAETPSNISVPASEVEETTTPAEEAKDIQEPTIRNKLKTIAQNLGVLVFETGEKYSSSSGVVTIPTEDKQVEGAQSPEHVFAHELGHAILQKRGVSYKGMPKAELDKWIPGWEKLKAISKAYRPEIHNHKLPKFRRHANKPDEIIADALGSFLLGISSKQDIDPIIKALNLNDYDLGLKGKTEPSAAPAAPTVEAAAPKAEAPPTLDTSDIKEVKGRHPQVQAAAKLLQDKKMSREEFEKYVDAYKPIETIKAETLYPPSSVESMVKAIRGEENKKKINVSIADGTRVGLRMDLPARDKGVPVVSIHEGKPNNDPKTGKPYKSSGKVIGYGSTGYLKDVFFAPRDQEKSLVMGIEPIKEPLQTAEGTWVNLSPEETYARVKDLVKDPAWKQVGFDPSRHGYFYDRKTTQPVVSASEMYQVGQFLLAKDVKYAPKSDFLYSLGGERAQVQAFEQTLRSLLNKFGLKDVGLKILDGMTDSGSYAAQIIRIAADAANPVRTLRHEAIHALRELGFFTDAQWKSLSKMAKDKWIDQYLKQRNVDGKPLKAGEESRYDAYMREYNGDMEKITEEAVSDAFADFDATKPPAGMLQALLKRMKDLFQSIKSALTKVESPEQIFGKVEKGELKAGAREAKGEAKSLRDRATANFKRWFGDSKVVDEKGEPLVVYHGTNKDIATFKPGRGGGAIWFASTPELANLFVSGGRRNMGEGAKKGSAVYPVYLSIKRPLDLGSTSPQDNLSVADVLRMAKLPSDEQALRNIAQANLTSGYAFVTPSNSDPAGYLVSQYERNTSRAAYTLDDPGLMAVLQAAGFDGLRMKEEGTTTYAAFNPTQIKSATGNNGDYSLTNADIRKSIGGRNPGEQAISIVNSLGMGVKPPEPGRFEKAKKILKDAGDNPSLTKESAKKTLTKWLDWFETTVFSSDSAFNNKIRRGIISDFKQNPEVLGMLLEASQSQTVHADALASQFMIDGGLQYNDDLKKWESVKKDDNFVALAKKIEDLAKKYNVTKDEMERIAHTYFVAKRLPGIIKRNEELDAEIKAERATAKPDRKQIEEWESLKVFVSDEQLAMMEPGLSLVKTIPELKEVVDIWQGIRKNNIDVMVNSGLWSPEYATAMWDNMDYVPYYREEQLEEGAGPQEFIRGLQVKSKEFQLKGSGAAVNDVFDNMIRWSQYAMNRAIRAHKATQMIDAALKIEVDGKPMATKVTEQKRGMNIVRAFRDGKQELYDMADPLFVPAFSSIQNVSIPTLTFMSKLANVLRQSVVLYPLFSVAQVPQDSFAAMFSSGLKTQHALKIPYLAVKEFIKTLSKTSQTHNELKRFGVVGVRDFSATVIRDDAEIYAGLRPPKGGWGKTKEFLEHIAMSADNAVRQAVYEASMQQGLNKSEALEKAFEIINFRRRGTSKMLNVMGQTVPFFYAYLSAQRVAYRVLSGVGISPSDRKEALTTLATTSAAVAALSMLYAMANGDDEDYAETPAAIRDRTLTIPGSGGVRIPLRPDFFLLPKIVAEHTYLMLSDKGYEDGAKFRKSMADALLSAVASPTPFPTAIKPAIEVAINYDFFQGKPLIGNFEKQKDIERQFRDSTSELAKILSNVPLSYSLEKGKFEGLSPIAIDHMIRGMLGSFGGLVLFGTNQFLHSDPDVPRPELSAKEMLAALPGTSGLLKRPQESALKNDFYQLRDAVEKAANTFNDIKTRSPEGIQAFLEDEKNAIRLGMAKGVDKINRHLSDIRRRMTIITNMPESQMSADEKSENIRQLRELEREILRSVNVKELREMAKI